MRATNFITGAGGLLQAVFFGYGSVRVRMHQLDLLTPYVLPECDSWKVIGFDYRGFTFDFHFESDKFHVTLTNHVGNEEAVYLVRHDDLVRDTMAVGQQHSITLQMISIVVHSELDKADIPEDVTISGAMHLCGLPMIVCMLVVAIGRLV